MFMHILGVRALTSVQGVKMREEKSSGAGIERHNNNQKINTFSVVLKTYF